MKNILVIAEGTMAQNFVSLIGKRRIAQNYYHIVSGSITSCGEKENKNVLFYNVDSTSKTRMQKLFDVTAYSNVFVVTDSQDDILEICNVIQSVDSRVRIVVLNQWNKVDGYKDSENVTISNANDLISGHLYDNLPNVPKIAKNVGLGNGEIMEMHIPFGSSYAFRHIGSITQQKWKIVALYRAGKQILPTSATMIRPNDTLLAVGNPMVLDGIYKLINKRKGFFPEPFGKNIFLLLDLKYDSKMALKYLKESIFMLSKMSEHRLSVLVINPTHMELVNEIKSFKSETVQIDVSFERVNIEPLIEFKISLDEIGLVLCSRTTLKSNQRNRMFYDLRKLIYVFGENDLGGATKALLLMKSEIKMESISSVVFDACETFNIPLKVLNCLSEKSIDESSTIETHYEAMAPLFNTNVEFESKIANPVREIAKMSNILEISPYSGNKIRTGVVEFVLAKGLDFMLSSNKHPKLLIPFEIGDI